MKLSKRVILFLPIFFVCFFMLSASSLAKTYEPRLPDDNIYTRVQDILVEDILPTIIQDLNKLTKDPVHDPRIPDDNIYIFVRDILVENILPTIIQNLDELKKEPVTVLHVFYDEQGNKLYESKEYTGYFSKAEIEKTGTDLLISEVLLLFRQADL